MAFDIGSASPLNGVYLFNAKNLYSKKILKFHSNLLLRMMASMLLKTWNIFGIFQIKFAKHIEMPSNDEMTYTVILYSSKLLAS